LRILIFTIFLILLGQADNNKSVIYQTDYKKAQQEAKEENKYLFVVITSENCRWCKKLKKTTLKNSEIEESLAKDYIAVALDRDSSYFPKFIEIEGVPSVVIIEPKSQKVIRNIVGFREDANDYLKWFRYVEIEKGE